MEVRAASRHVRVTPRKARLVVDLIRGRPVEQALGILAFTRKRAAGLVAKTVRAAVANAEATQNVDVDALYIKRAYVDAGPTWKRYIPRAHGRATRILKRTSHITVVLDERRQRE